MFTSVLTKLLRLAWGDDKNIMKDKRERRSLRRHRRDSETPAFISFIRALFLFLESF